MHFNKNIVFSIISCVGILFCFLLNSSQNTIADLSLVSSTKNEDGTYESPENITIIEELGLLFLSSGLSYNFGTNENVVELGLQTILSTDLSKLNATDDDASILDEYSLENTLDKMEENSETLDNLNQSTEDVTTESTEEIDWNNFYSKKSSKAIDKEGNELGEKETLVSFTTPSDFSKENIDTTSNVWNLNYRFYDGALTGVEPSYWYSSLFDNDDYFERAWTSLKWISQDLLNCYIVADTDSSFEAIVYSSNEKYYWYLYLDKLSNYDAFNFDVQKNTIAMTAYPITIEKAYNIMYNLGYSEEE